MNDKLFFNKPSAQFTLQTRTGGTNIPIFDTNRTQFTFTNIDIKKIVGARVYEMYDYFNITLVYALWTVFSGTPTGYESIATINLSGLDFVCSDNKASAVVGYFQVSNVTATSATTNKFLTNMFLKKDKVNLTIEFKSVNNNDLIPITASSYPISDMFVFRIDPVDLTESPMEH